MPARRRTQQLEALCLASATGAALVVVAVARAIWAIQRTPARPATRLDNDDGRSAVGLAVIDIAALEGLQQVKIRRQLPLDQALEGISTMIEQLRSSTVIIDDHEITPGDPVSLEIEIESEDGSFELEFEIKWRADQQTTQPSESESSPAETPNEGHW